jgi:hypothetical protein
MNNGTFDLNAFIKESKDLLTNPKSYFATMRTSGGMVEPLIKAVIYGVIAGAFSFLWSLLKIGAAGSVVFGGAYGIMIFVGSIITAIIGLFIGAVVLLVISSICKGSTDFEANVRVVAATMVLMPISAFFGFAMGINLYLGLIIGLAINIYVLWLFYNGLVEALKTSVETTKIVMYVLIALLVVIMLLGIGAKRRTAQMFDNPDVKEMMKDIQKN